jgi:hypothetical protein
MNEEKNIGVSLDTEGLLMEAATVREWLLTTAAAHPRSPSSRS